MARKLQEIVAKKPAPEPEAILERALTVMRRWPQAWRGTDRDVAYGERLLEQLIPFVTHLVTDKQLAANTLRRHLNYLFLLGGELIYRINVYTEDRRLAPSSLLDRSIDEAGGPLCKHVEPGADQTQYDSTCRQLHAFRAVRKRRAR